MKEKVTKALKILTGCIVFLFGLFTCNEGIKFAFGEKVSADILAIVKRCFVASMIGFDPYKGAAPAVRTPYYETHKRNIEKEMAREKE